ncbi:unnamed protein product [Enterobius vermicularis]|uniref:Caenorhabditis elegans ly-6-related family-containing protein n=1 Tax=Enterobius vermicularis TaxID=51028 RepID=A0A0N4VKT9_ENTVE|nr:unnamed protein product [Enterobius vermicularis]
MSPIYEAAWSELQHVYYAPRNFTKLCDSEHIGAYSVRSVACQTVCIRMTEILVIGGLRFKSNIRGCMDDILRGGFNKTIINRHRWYLRDSCNFYQKRVLFQLPIEKSDDSSISLCVCYGNYCNGATSNSVQLAEHSCKIFYFLCTLLLLLICR